MKRRDKMDSNRVIAPLRPAADAVIVNTDGLDVCQVLKQVKALI
jgi:cytidylate kinase